MPSIADTTRFVPQPVHPWRNDFAIALAVVAVILTIAAAAGFPKLSDVDGDNDSLMRLVQVRDLLAGQGWFDLTQYRMGPPGGFVMHWSRLVDAPLAMLMLAGEAVTGSQHAGEAFAMTAWPLLLAGAAMFALLRLARWTGGKAAVLPAAVIGGAALHYLGQFQPGSIDHHNVQIVLMLTTLAGIVAAPRTPRAAWLAGAAAALMPAVGMETVPYVAAAGGAVALCWWWSGCEERQTAMRFGLAFAAVSLAALVTTVAPHNWFATQCDAFSGGQAGAALLAGVGLSIAAASRFGATRSRRAALLVMLGAALAAFATLALPQCLADPYASLDPRLKRFWLNSIIEAQSFAKLARSEPVMLAGYYGTPLLAAGLLAARLFRLRFTRGELIVAGFLAAGLLVSLWQVRGATFTLPLAVIPLSGWVGRLRLATRRHSTGRANLKMAAAWLASLSIMWASAAEAATSLFENAEAESPAPADACYRNADFGALGALPSSTVLAVSNLGAAILANTGHRVLAGPYHRNVAGNLAALDALMSPPEKARQIAIDHGVTLVAHCPGNPETKAVAEWAPDGLAAALEHGQAPDWLIPVGPSGPLTIYRVDRTSTR